ncbi:MAG: TetR/AcrR family transcriptional regulator [Actinobacteria bacterium]|nr:TetR/AcrR family transcriptional regulator [Actinomycetota bacterium]
MAGERRPRGEYAVGRERRSTILQTALREFAEHGYHGTSLNRIAERAGISEAGLRHHFTNKDALLVAVLEQRDAASERPPEGRDPLVGIADLEHHIAIVEGNTATIELARLFTVLTAEATTRDHPAAAWAVERYRSIRASVEQGIRGGIASGEFRSDVDAARLARQIIAVMDGLQLQWLLDPESVDMTRDFRDYTTELLSLLRGE